MRSSGDHFNYCLVLLAAAPQHPRETERSETGLRERLFGGAICPVDG
jgi:hypothetical protein